jgi:integrase
MIRRENRRYYLFLRNGIFYTQFVDPVTKKRHTAKSTGKTTRDEALLVVLDWLKNGIPQKSSENEAPIPLKSVFTMTRILDELKNTTLTIQDVVKIEKIFLEQGLIKHITYADNAGVDLFTEFLQKFWDYEKSPYVQEKIAHKINITHKHTQISLSRVNTYWVPYFKGKYITQITRKDIVDFSNDLERNFPKLSSLTLKQIRRVGVTALRWAFANDIIPANPTLKLPEYSSKFKKRGVLTPEEARRLFQLEWKDIRCLLANLVGMTTGLRSAEILALRLENIGEEYLTIENSFSLVDGLKSTKTEEARTVPIIPQIRDALRFLGSKNPYGNGYIFYSDSPENPLEQHKPLNDLKRMLVQMRIKDKLPRAIEQGDTAEVKNEKKRLIKELKEEAKAYWKKRNVIFHSWRHFYSARMADKIEARKVMLATGHKTEAVFTAYADHALEQDLHDVAVTSEQVFGGLLPQINM